MPRTKHPEGHSGKGRPSLYEPRFAGMAYEACRWGANIADLADFFNVTARTIDNWRKHHDDFFRSIEKGRYAWDSGRIVSALRKRAMGFEYDEIHEEFIEIDGECFIEKVERTGRNGSKKNIRRLVRGRKIRVVHKKVVPDMLAIMFWLQNRQPEEWKNVQRQIVETTGRVDHLHSHELDLTKLKREDLERLRDIVAKGSPEDPAPVPGGSGGGFSLREPLALRPASVERG